MYVTLTNLLIVGAPRSGTTLLAAMLASHPQVCVLFEDLWGGAGRILAKRYKGVKLCVPNQVDMQYRWTLLDLLLARIPKLWNVPPLLKTATSRYSISDYLLNEDLKLVAILRDGDSVTSSMQKRTSRTYAEAAATWLRAIEIIHELEETNPHRLYLVDFDQLVSAPERTARALCSALDLDFEPGMLEGYKHTPIYETQRIDSSRASRPGHWEPRRITSPHYESLLSKCL